MNKEKAYEGGEDQGTNKGGGNNLGGKRDPGHKHDPYHRGRKGYGRDHGHYEEPGPGTAETETTI